MTLSRNVATRAVGRRDDPPHHGGQVDHRPRVLASLGVVGVEQSVAGLPGDHRGQLPAEIGRVADAAVVALPLPHRHEVSGVAGEEHPALAERARDPGVVGVHAMPDHVDAVGVRHERRQHAGDELRLLDLLIGLVGVNHELEPANSVRDRDRRVRPGGIGADLAVGVPQRIGRDVDDQPARRRGGALERHTHQAAGRAASTVAADDVACADGLGARRSDDVDGDAVGESRRTTPCDCSTAPRRSRSAPAHAAVPRRPWAARSRCAWASRNVRRVAPFRRAAAGCRRRSAGSGWARCAAARARRARSTGRCAVPRRRARRRAGSRSGCRVRRPPASEHLAGQARWPA